MYEYTLDELQEWYGREKDAVSKSAKPLILDRLKEKHRMVAQEAISFINKSYAEQPTPLSIRQVHYHLVHQLLGVYSNTIKDYNKLITLILKARIGGLIPWHMISETESLVSQVVPAGMDPEAAIKKALEEAQKQAGLNPWDAMNKYVVVFTEKRELQPQLEYITNDYFVRLISLRGYGAYPGDYIAVAKKACDDMVWFNWDLDDSLAHTTMHELGHNLGLDCYSDWWGSDSSMNAASNKATIVDYTESEWNEIKLWRSFYWWDTGATDYYGDRFDP